MARLTKEERADLERRLAEVRKRGKRGGRTVAGPAHKYRRNA